MEEMKRTISAAKKTSVGTIIVYIKKRIAEKMNISNGDLLEIKKAKEEDLAL